jgi:hypothetical protein
MPNYTNCHPFDQSQPVIDIWCISLHTNWTIIIAFWVAQMFVAKDTTQQRGGCAGKIYEKS